MILKMNTDLQDSMGRNMIYQKINGTDNSYHKQKWLHKVREELYGIHNI